MEDKEEKKQKVIEYLQRMPFYKWAAAYAGIHRNTLDNWMEEDKDFCARCETAKAQAIEHFGKRATPDFILKSTDPESFKDRKEVEVTGDPLVVIKDGSKTE